MGRPAWVSGPIFTQHVGAGHPWIWHVSQDLVSAPCLKEASENWVSPEQGCVEAIRDSRDADGEVKSIEDEAALAADE